MPSRKSLTQSGVINFVAERAGVSRDQSRKFFEDLADLATNEIQSTGEFVMPGFGKLVRAERSARQGRNPATGETIQIPAKTSLKFRLNKGIKSRILDVYAVEEVDIELSGDPVTRSDSDLAGDPSTRSD